MDNADSYALYHFSGAQCYAAIAFESLSWDGKPLAEGPRGAYLFALSGDGTDLFTADHMYVKANAPGMIRLLSGSANPPFCEAH